MKTLYYPGQRNGNFGWAVCNTHLGRALEKHFRITESPQDVVFMPVADHELNPISGERGRINIGYTFFEYPLGEKAAENAKRFDLLFCGSTWCQQRLAERGIHNTEALIQGVNQDVFYPAPIQHEGLRIFSGGKFEHRKGHDLVIRAFAEFIKIYPEAKLVCTWHNPWPSLIFTALTSLLAPTEGSYSQEDLFERILLMNGIPRKNFEVWPSIRQEQLAEVMRGTNFGIFPNRCEGGTNLVMMEYAACGREVVANCLTGHADVANLIGSTIPAEADHSHWAKQEIKDIVRAMEVAELLPCPVRGPVPTWEDAAEKVRLAVERIEASRL